MSTQRIVIRKRKRVREWLRLNLSVPEIVSRYMASLIIVVLGAMMHSVVVMVLCIPLLITAIAGWSPLYQILGINHSAKATQEEG